MQVPEHIVSLYIATCGQNGPGLGSDEKEIILLVFVLLEVTSGQVSFFQYAKGICTCFRLLTIVLVDIEWVGLSYRIIPPFYYFF